MQRVVLPTAFFRRKLTPKFIKQKSQLYRPQTRKNGEDEGTDIENKISFIFNGRVTRKNPTVARGVFNGNFDSLN